MSLIGTLRHWSAVSFRRVATVALIDPLPPRCFATGLRRLHRRQILGMRPRIENILRQRHDLRGERFDRENARRPRPRVGSTPSVLGLDEARYQLAGCIMTKDEEVQVREAVAEAFRQGCVEARAGMSSDLRGVIDYFNAEMRQLRREICKLAKLPMPPPLDVNGYEDGPLQ